jgi:hypothetical protein
MLFLRGPESRSRCRSRSCVRCGGDATAVGPLGININYACSGSFDFETDVLYFPAFTLSPIYGYFLFACDEDTGACTIVGEFPGNTEYTVWAISYELNMEPPIHIAVHDTAGNNIVIEFIEGKVNVYDNPIGVMTNAPTFDWHLTNLRNYVNLAAGMQNHLRLTV